MENTKTELTKNVITFNIDYQIGYLQSVYDNNKESAAFSHVLNEINRLKDFSFEIHNNTDKFSKISEIFIEDNKNNILFEKDGETFTDKSIEKALDLYSDYNINEFIETTISDNIIKANELIQEGLKTKNDLVLEDAKRLLNPNGIFQREYQPYSEFKELCIKSRLNPSELLNHMSSGSFADFESFSKNHVPYTRASRLNTIHSIEVHHKNNIAIGEALNTPNHLNHNKMSTENQNQEKQKSDKQYHTFTGTLGADADVKEVKGEKLVAAISVYVKDETGNSKRHDATLWDETIEKHFTAKKMENFDKNTVKEFADNLKKGDQVKINGYFKDVDYKDKDGNPKTKQEFVITNFNNHTPKADIKHDQSENVKITGKINNDPIITDEDGKKKAVFYINYKPNENSDWVSKKCQVIGDYVDKCKISELKKGDIATIEGFEGSKYERTIKGTENKETVSDIFVGETKVVKQSQEKSQEQSQGTGMGV